MKGYSNHFIDVLSQLSQTILYDNNAIVLFAGLGKIPI